MIKAASLSAEYSLIYSGDPALVQPPTLPEGASDDEKKAHAAECERHAAALERARETNQWQSLIREGEMPTLFHVRPLYGTTWDWLVGEVNRRSLVQIESCVFALRLAMRRVENFGPHKVRHTKVDGIEMATTEIIDAIYAEAGGEGRAIVEELGGLVMIKGSNPLRPKS